jgi:hypothetical protein
MTGNRHFIAGSTIKEATAKIWKTGERKMERIVDEGTGVVSARNACRIIIPIFLKRRDRLRCNHDSFIRHLTSP